MNTESKKTTLFQSKKIEIIVLLYILLILVTGLAMQSFSELIDGLGSIFTASGTLITDYMVVGGMGAALVNAAVVALIGYVILIINKVSFRGISIAVIFTLMGFALMGKSIWSILPIIAGAWIYSKFTRREFVAVIYPALFGTALAPLVTNAAFEFGWGIFGGVLIGLVVGFFISPIANRSLTFHEGYNLYNVGFSAGFVGLVLMNVIRAFGFDAQGEMLWGTAFDSFLRIYSILLFASMIVLGIFIDRKNVKNYKLILQQTGVSVTDFVNIAGFGNTLINMGLVGLIGVGFLELVGANYNGPTLCGLLTMVGFAAFGKQPRNILPIMVGIWLGSLISVYEPNAPGTVLALLFGTTLAPIAGRFGPIVGVIAGFAHLSVVSTIGFIHGGLNLYNNGFSGGFVASFFVAIHEGIKGE